MIDIALKYGVRHELYTLFKGITEECKNCDRTHVKCAIFAEGLGKMLQQNVKQCKGVYE